MPTNPSLARLRCRHGAGSLEGVDLSWGGSRISDASAQALAAGCPRLHILGLAGTAVSEEGVRAVVGAALSRGTFSHLELDLGSCRGVGRAVRQAASQGMQQLRRALGL